MTAYYNEFDPFAAQWLRNLVDGGKIAAGIVDERDIRELRAVDVMGTTQAHFFAGIGVWSHALQLAGWPPGVPVWTGSCPCQPFSTSGRRLGFNDPRHLWPVWERLIAECAPPIVFGEQVDSPLGREWLCLVRADLEALGYAVGAVDLCAASVGAPHIRQRLFWVAYAHQERRDGIHSLLRSAQGERNSPQALEASGGGQTRRLGDPDGAGLERRQVERRHHDAQRQATQRAGGELGGVAHGEGLGRGQGWPGQAHGAGQEQLAGRGQARGLGYPASGGRGIWGPIEWLPCRDGKWRPAQPGTQPLAHGPAPGVAVICTPEGEHAYSRTGALRGIGNAIVPQVAAAFIRSVMEHLICEE